MCTYFLLSNANNSRHLALQSILTDNLSQGHGCLNDIYSSIEKAAILKGWNGVDLVIIGGDFQVSIVCRLSLSFLFANLDLRPHVIRMT